MIWTLTPASQFAHHALEWQTLNRATLNSPLLELEFVQPLLTEFGSGDELLAVCTTAQTVVAMAILTPSKTGVWATFQPSQAPLGMWLHRPELPLEALLATLLPKLPGWPMVLGLTQLDPALAARPSAESALQTLDYVDTSRITLEGSFEDYWNGRGKNLRSNMKKQRAKLLKEGIGVRMESSRAPEAMAQAIADYGQLESAGWKAQGGTAIHPDNAQGRFYQSMLEGFCRRGAATVNRYWFDDQLAAMNLCIEGDASLIILKTTYDERISSQFSPAFLMLEETCQQLYAEGKFKRLEFYGKVMEWHLRWTDEVRTLYHVNHYRWPVLRQLRAIVNQRAALTGRLRALLPARLPAQPVKPSAE
jgi:CelD/BcsL family acetyltransferase involved in cellulose biosynthesis